jgi:polysaccharide biosynthesis transport protein
VYTGLNTPEDFIRVVKNHWFLIVVPILVSVGLAWGVYEWLPKSYRASTLLNFEGQKVRYVKDVEDHSAGGDSEKPDALMQSRIRLMKEVLYKKEILVQVAQEFHLYGYEKADGNPEYDDNVATRMRGFVQFHTGEAPFLRVSFADPVPAVARDVVTRLAELFVKEFTQNREVIATSSSEFLQHEVDALKVQLETKDRLLTQFKQAHLGELPEQMGSNLQALDRLESEARAAQEMEKAVDLRLESVDKAIREYEDPETRGAKDPRIGKIKELERTLAGLQFMYKENYPDVASVRNEIRRLKAMTTEDYIALYVEQDPPEVDGERKGKRKRVDPYMAQLLKQREEILRELELVHLRQARIAADVKKYEGRIDKTTVHQQELMTMQRDYENLQKNYHSLVEKKLTVGIAGNLDRKRQGTQMRIIEPAKLPVWPEKPNVFVIMFGGLAIGCALGFGSAFGLEILRRGFASGEEIEVTLGLPVIATISQFDSVWSNVTKKAALRSRDQERLLALPGLSKDVSRSSYGSQVAVAPEVVTMWCPRSVLAEQYRVAATRVELMVGKQQSNVIVVASAMMGEGKSSTALNLAHVFARDYSKKTVVVDCDFKRPMVHALVGIEANAGLSDVLIGKKTLEECLEYHEQLGLWILSCGTAHFEATALSHSNQLSGVISELRERFQCVILDTPPLLPVAEANLIARMGDIVALVIRARITRRDAVKQAINLIGNNETLAVILNGVELNDMPHYSQRYYYEPQHKQLR